ncbi:MAG: hypothetical protein JW704_03670 [Anaerolineaceae bacterium]|nr:hypothetical protein [Anaerolineaceae bacterium]MBN2676433.1 hypothetical protein [Anaerolineaceae bacterium]
MIPQNINREHILKALAEIRRDGVPPGRESKKFILIYEMVDYPPKYVVSIANIHANGEEWPSFMFSGGKETNEFLENRGFSIIRKDKKELHDGTLKARELSTGQFSGGKETKKVVENTRISKEYGKKAVLKRFWFTEKDHIDNSSAEIIHNERCQECKKTIQRLLENIFGIVLVNHRLTAGTFPEDYPNHPYLTELTAIFDHLQRLRNNQEFVRTRNLPPVDFYVPTLDAFIEFDESQHFTKARKISLLHYPIDLPLGFDINRWMRLCDEIDAKDTNPSYRDEQRAWYDTLRDLVPITRRMKPTIRLHSRDYKWCSLNPESEDDKRKFKDVLAGKMVSGKSPSKKVSVVTKYEMNPKLARIIIINKWNADEKHASDILKAICDDWPVDTRVNCLITPGAFLTFPWPSEIKRTFDNKHPPQDVIQKLFTIAEVRCREVIIPDIQSNLAKFTDSITIGIDTDKPDISTSSQQIRYLHSELVALLDLRTGKYHWTGKTLPTAGQEKGLVRIENLSSHFIDIGYGKVMILGCHDLAIFSERGKKTTFNPWRKRVREEFTILAKIEAPIFVLHHPHTTDSSMTWKACWNCINEELPTVKNYVGAGVYYYPDGESRDNLASVLTNTKMGSTIDFIINLA